jgi:hypothetical protein
MKLTKTDKLIMALTILKNYQPAVDISVGHDVIYLGVGKDVSLNDHEFLIDELDLGHDKETDGYFVFA